MKHKYVRFKNGYYYIMDSFDWETKDELLFLILLGTSTRDNRIASREYLLERYIILALTRQDWGDINKYKVIYYAAKMLLAERKRIEEAPADGIREEFDEAYYELLEEFRRLKLL